MRAEIIPLPSQLSKVLELDKPNKIFQNELVDSSTVDSDNHNIKKFNELFKLGFEDSKDMTNSLKNKLLNYTLRAGLFQT